MHARAGLRESVRRLPFRLDQSDPDVVAVLAQLPVSIFLFGLQHLVALDIKEMVLSTEWLNRAVGDAGLAGS